MKMIRKLTTLRTALYLIVMAAFVTNSFQYAIAQDSSDALVQNTHINEITVKDRNGSNKEIELSIPDGAPDGLLGLGHPAAALKDYSNRRDAYAGMFENFSVAADFEEAANSSKQVKELIENLDLGAEASGQLRNIVELAAYANKGYVKNTGIEEQILNQLKTMSRTANAMRKAGTLEKAGEGFEALNVILKTAGLGKEFYETINTGLETTKADMGNRLEKLQGLKNSLNRTSTISDQALVEGLEQAIDRIEGNSEIAGAMLTAFRENKADLVNGSIDLGVTIGNIVLTKAVVGKVAIGGAAKVGAAAGTAAGVTVAALFAADAYAISELMRELDAGSQQNSRLQEAILAASFHRDMMKVVPEYDKSLEALQTQELYFRNMAEAARVNLEEGSWISRLANHSGEYKDMMRGRIESYNFSADRAGSGQAAAESFVPKYLRTSSGSSGINTGSSSGSQSTSSPARSAYKPTITASYKPMTRQAASTIVKNYGSVPGGVTLEGEGEGIENISSAEFRAADGTILLNGSILYEISVTQKEMKTILLAIDADDKIGVSLVSGYTTYGALPKDNCISLMLRQADWFLAHLAYGWKSNYTDYKIANADRLKKRDDELGNVMCYFRFCDYKFALAGSRYELISSSFFTTLIPIKVGARAADGGGLPDFEAIESREYPENLLYNIKHIADNAEYYMRERMIRMVNCYGEATAFGRALKRNGVDLRKLAASM